MMNYINKGIGVLLIVVLIVSCKEDESPNPTGLSEITLSSFSATAGGDGTIITVKPLSIGASSYVVDFGDPNSDSDVITIEGQGNAASYDYPNEAAQVSYTITVTAKSNAGLTDVTMAEDIVVTHTVVPSISTVPASPTLRDANVFALFSDGFEFGGDVYSWEHGEDAAGGTVVSVGGNDVVQFSRLGSTPGVLSVGTIETANAFLDGVAATNIHFDVHADFAEGVDVLKVTLVNSGASQSYVVDGLALTDGEWVSFDFDLATDFSAAVTAIDQIKFELGTGGTAKDHATISVDNVYLYKDPTSVILNGDFENGQEMWKFPIFTDGTTNPYGSSSDGSNLDYDGNDTGSKTAGAKWSGSQSGGEFRSADSRYAYQELTLTPNTNYILQYQYAIKDDSGDDPIGGRRVVGLIMDGYYVDGADAVDELGSNNLGYHEGFVAEGKFSDTVGGAGTLVNIPFTSPASGEVSIMFYAVTPVDAYIDNVKVLLN
ncbi:MAG: hypothetical protein RIC06_00080 [Cyclobacteriaceae bacterium]